MKREGSPWTGLGAVVFKELADHLSSIRMQILEGLMFFTALGTVYAATQEIKQTVGEDPFIFLKLFTISKQLGSQDLPSFAAFLGFLIPLSAIALAFDAVNGEHNRRTLSRVLAQPIYRDALLLGKFLAGLATLGIMLTALWLLVTGLGIFFLGVVPGAEEVGRTLMFLLAALAYAGVWLALAMVFSVIYRQPATSALAALSVWLFFTVFWNIVIDIVARVIRPIEYGLPQEELAQVQVRLFLSRLSPNTLYGEILVALLNPIWRGLSALIFPQLLEGAIAAPLPFLQSILLVWPQLTGLVAAVVLLFAWAYVNFQRQEVRA